MVAVFLVIHVFIAMALIGVVLLQRSDTDGFGLGSGSGSNFLSGRQTANLLTRTTAILAAAFMLNSLWLGILTSHRSKASFVDTVETAGQKKEAATPANTKDAVKKDIPEVKDATAPADAKPEAKDKAKDADKKPEVKAAPKAEKPAAKPKKDEGEDSDSDASEPDAPAVPQAD